MDLVLGYLKGKLGKEMMYTKRPNHMGVLMGEVEGYEPNKGYAKIKLSKELNLGDSIAIKDSSCKISELMEGKNNIKTAQNRQIITIGRIKGKILKGDKVYKTVSGKLNKEIIQIASRENIKRPINAKIYLKVKDLWSNIKLIEVEDTIVKKADNNGISKERIREQLSKTGNTTFEINEIQVIADDNIIVPISGLNSVRRNAFEKLEKKLVQSFKRNKKVEQHSNNENKKANSEVKVSVLLNSIKEDINYTKITGIDNIYVPFRLFLSNKERVEEICKHFDTYLLLPSITKSNYERLIESNLVYILKKNRY